MPAKAAGRKTPFRRTAMSRHGVISQPANARQHTRQDVLEVKEDEVTEDGGHGWLLNHPAFEGLIQIVILANAAQMGLSVEFRQPSYALVWMVLEHMFTAIFTMEMALKLYFLRYDYFRDTWNLSDFILVWVAIIDNWVLGPILGQSEMERMAVLRIFRVTRIARMIKMLKFNREVLVLLQGIFASLRAMLSIAVLLSIIIYAFSLFCIEMIEPVSPASVEQLGDSCNDEYSQVLNTEFYFGSLPKTWLTLFNMVILAEWPEIVWPLSQTHPGMVVIFGGFVILTSFGIMNLIIGVLMERTERAMQVLRDVQIDQYKRKQMNQVRAITAAVIDDAAVPGSPRFESGYLETDNLIRLFDDIGLPRNFTNEELHAMLDMDGSGHVTLNEFVVSMFRLIYSDDFQDKCLSAMSMNQIKSNIKSGKDEVLLRLSDLSEELRDFKRAAAKQHTDMLRQVELMKPPAREEKSAEFRKLPPDISLSEPSPGPPTPQHADFAVVQPRSETPTSSQSFNEERAGQFMDDVAKVLGSAGPALTKQQEALDSLGVDLRTEVRMVSPSDVSSLSSLTVKADEHCQHSGGPRLALLLTLGLPKISEKPSSSATQPGTRSDNHGQITIDGVGGDWQSAELLQILDAQHSPRSSRSGGVTTYNSIFRRKGVQQQQQQQQRQQQQQQQHIRRGARR